jgi:hypothetical protein
VGWEKSKKHTMLLQLTKVPTVKGQRGVKKNAAAFKFLEEYMAANMMRTAGHTTGMPGPYTVIELEHTVKKPDTHGQPPMSNDSRLSN